MIEYLRGKSDIVANFSRSLTTAIYDCELERAGEVIHYYHDADVVVKLIFGFLLEDLNVASPRDDRSLMVRALLSSGYLGSIQLLRPHALELDEQIRLQPDYRGAIEAESYGKRVQQFLKSWGADQAMATLHEIISKPVPMEEKTQSFLNTLQGLAPQSFVAVELARGTWQKRLKLLYQNRVLTFDMLGQEMHELFSDQLVDRFDELIRESRVRFTLSNLRDASALTMLRRMILERETSDSVPLVRFHTESPTLKKLFAKEEMIGLLSYPSLRVGRWRSPGSDMIVRDDSYFIMRASFEALRFPGLELAGSDQPVVSYEQLKELAIGLRNLPDRSEVAVQNFLNGIEIDGKPLGQVILDFESLSLLQTIWVRYKLPKHMADLIPKWTEVWAFAGGNATEIPLRENISVVREELDRNVRRIRTWYEDYTLIQAAARKLQKRLRSYENPDPMRDLGLIRWGVELGPKARRRLVGLVRSLIEGEEDGVRGLPFGHLATALESIQTEEDCVIACACLWLLNRHERVVRVIDRFEKRKHRLPAGLATMRAAARLHAKHLTIPQKKQLVDELRMLGQRLTGRARGQYLLGLGYVAFHAWQDEALDKDGARLKGKLTYDDSVAALVSEWSHLSFEAGKEALGVLEPRTLAWAFAVNHCAYVGAAAGFPEEVYRPYLSYLAKLNASDVWHFRFSDTIAYYHILRAQRLFDLHAEGGEKPIGSGIASLICKDLTAARQALDEIESYYNDREIPQHLKELQLMEQFVNCADLS